MRKRDIESIVGVPEPATQIERGDVLVVFGRKKEIERMARS
jgi:K+/H+ antiporter YhaU regulatory subunit KhtT